MSDRLSRTERRNLQKQDEQLLALPLHMGPDPRSIAAHARFVTRALRSPLGSPSATAVGHIAALFDRTVPKQHEKTLACRKGCSHCCSQMVVVTAPEAFFVASRLRGKAIESVKDVARETAVLTMEERLGRNIFCPMLDDTGSCSIYAARPLGCHGFVSQSVDACIATFTRGETPNIPMPADYTQVLYTCRTLLLACLRLAGLHDGMYELNSAVAVALTTENAEARWLKGENIFAGLKALPPPPPQFDIAIRQLAAFVAPTV